MPGPYTNERVARVLTVIALVLFVVDSVLAGIAIAMFT